MNSILQKAVRHIPAIRNPRTGVPFLSTDLLYSRDNYHGPHSALKWIHAKANDFCVNELEMNVHPHPGSVGSFYYPDATDLHRVMVASSWFMVIFYLDDLCDEPEKFMQDNPGHIQKYSGLNFMDQMEKTIDRILDNPDYELSDFETSIPVYSGLSKLVKHTVADIENCEFIQRYLSNVKQCIHRIITEPKSTDVEVNDINEYIKIRKKESGLFWVINLIEYVHNNYLTEYADIVSVIPELQTAQELACATYALGNDMHGYINDMHRDNTLINVVLKSRYDNNMLFLPHAIDEALAIVNQLYVAANDVIDRCSHLAEENKGFLSLSAQQIGSVKLLCEGMKTIMMSEFHYANAGPRYKSKHHFMIDMRL